MSSDSTKPLVFISYAHLDEPDPPEEPAEGKICWLSFVMKFLRPGVKGRKYEVWMDRLMPRGADWSPKLEVKARACDIFVLLISANLTSSDYILDKEIPIVRERQRNSDGVYFYPLLIDWTPRAALAQVNDKNLRPPDAKPFSSWSPSERSRAMAEAADEIADVAKAIEERKAAAEQVADAVKAAIAGKKTAIVPNLELKGILPLGLAAAPLAVVAISGLSETGYERLVGLDAELQGLDAARATAEPISSRLSLKAARASRLWSTVAQASSRRLLLRRRTRARLVALQPGHERARDRSRRVPGLGAGEARGEGRDDQVPPPRARPSPRLG